MKKIKVFIMLMISLSIIGCGSKVPFKEETPLKDAALVYVYMPEYGELVESSSSQNYTIRINDKRVEQKIKSNEYISFNLKPEQIKFSAIRAYIEEKAITLDLKAGEVYYLRIRDSLANGGFSFENVSNAVGTKEIVKTELAGSLLEDVDSVINELVDVSGPAKEEVIIKPKSSSSSSSSSKLDELEKAYKMKEKGILTEDEFKTLKSQIISK